MLTATHNINVAPNYQSLCAQVAQRIADVVKAKPNAVLGLATGSSPLGVYDELIRRHTEEGLDFSQVTCFNLDEYYPMEPDSPQSYHRFMEINLFNHINCTRWHVPSGVARSREEIDDDCRLYESAISVAGGLDLQLLGIGRTGHVGFNEPGSPVNSRTRLVTLAPVTRQDAIKDFGGLENVPTQAITMGVGTILEAREIVLMASGNGKAEIIHRSLTGDETDEVPATFLRRHKNTRFFLDTSAAKLMGEFIG